MNKKIKKKWVEALRSGKYKQGHGMLCKRDTDGTKYHCCLGVLTDLYYRETQGHAMPKSFETKDFLSKNVTAWSGVGDEDPQTGKSSISELNDADGKSFKQIANLIDKHL